MPSSTSSSTSRRRRPASAPPAAAGARRHGPSKQAAHPTTSFTIDQVYGKYRPNSGRPRFAARNATKGLTPEGFIKALHTVTTRIDQEARPTSAQHARTVAVNNTSAGTDRRPNRIRPSSAYIPSANNLASLLPPRRSLSAAPRRTSMSQSSKALRPDQTTRRVNALLKVLHDDLIRESPPPTPPAKELDYDKLAYWPPRWYVDQFDTWATRYSDLSKKGKPLLRQIHSAPPIRSSNDLDSEAKPTFSKRRESPSHVNCYDGNLEDIVIEEDNELSPQASQDLPTTSVEDKSYDDSENGENQQGVQPAQDDAAQDMAKFVGPAARQAFFDSLPEANRTHKALGKDVEVEDYQEAISPRMQYIIELLRSKRLPWPTILRKASSPNKLSLEGLGLGDEVALVLAKYLSKFPQLVCLNLGANRLRMESVRGVVKAVTSLSSLRELDLRQNDVGSAACTMCDWLQSDECRLERLCLSKAKLSDREAVPLMAALTSNRSVTFLDLSHNALCKEESLNFLHPEFTTGGEAVADLMTRNHILKELDLSWNFIRDASALAIGQALQVNKGLTRLDLSYNTFGHMPSQALGVALLKNTSLLHLNMAYNSITPKGSWVLCTAFSTNKTLTELNMDGNRLGKLGSEAILSVVRRCGSTDRHLTVNMRGCDCESVDASLFDPMEPTGEYTLDLSDPYDRMILNELLRLASFRAGCRFLSLSYRPPPSPESGNKSSMPFTPIELVYARRRASVIASWANRPLAAATMTSGRRPAGAALLKMALQGVHTLPPAPPWAQDCKSILQQLSAATVSHRQQKAKWNLLDSPTASVVAMAEVSLEHDETQKLKFNLEQLLNTLGFNPSSLLIDQLALVLPLANPTTEKELLRAVFMAVVHVVEAEHPDLTYSQIMRMLREHLGLAASEDSIFLDTALHMYFEREHRDGFISVVQAVDWLMDSYVTLKEAAEKPTHEVLVHKETGEPWDPPSEGTARVDFVQLKLPPSAKEFQDPGGLQALIDNIKKGTTEQDRVMIFETSLRNSDVYLNAAQAQLLIDVMSKEHPKAWAIEYLLPVMTNPYQAARVLLRNLSHMEIIQLRIKMRNVFNIHLGNPTSHYCLDLSKQDERQALNKLGRINNFEKSVLRLSENVGLNTSQKGNGDNFRTEALNGKATVINEAVFSNEIPQAGKMRFDYVSTSRPHANVYVATQRQLQYLLDHVSLRRLYNAGKKRAETGRHKKTSRAVTSPGASLSSTTRGGSPVTSLFKAKQSGVGAAIRRKNGDGMYATSRGALEDSTAMPINAGAEFGASHGQMGPADSFHALPTTSGPPLSDATNHAPPQQNSDSTGRDHRRFAAKLSIDTSPSKTVGEDGESRSPTKAKFAVTVNTSQEASLVNKDIHNSPHFHRALHSWVPASAVLDWWTEYKESDSFSVEAAKYWGTETTRVSPAEQCLRDKNRKRSDICKEIEVKGVGHAVYLKLVVLECLIFTMWITAKQAAEILKEFPSEYWGKVQAAVVLFSRIVDLENSELVMDALSQLEYLELCHRIGYLNIVNPLKPDRYYSLDLRIWEQRELCKVFIKLAIEEPGENWVDETYQWSFYDEPLAGWGLPLSWATPDEDSGGRGGPKRSGRLTLIYTSTGPGCFPKWEVRKELKVHFLCSNIPQMEVDWRTNTSAKLWDMVSAHDKVRRSPIARTIGRTIQVMQSLRKEAKEAKQARGPTPRRSSSSGSNGNST